MDIIPYGPIPILFYFIIFGYGTERTAPRTILTGIFPEIDESAEKQNIDRTTVIDIEVISMMN